MNKKRMSAAIAALLTAGTVFAETPVGKTVDEAIDDCFEVIFDFEFLDEENPEDCIEEVIIDDSGIAMEDEEVTAENEEKTQSDQDTAVLQEISAFKDVLEERGLSSSNIRSKLIKVAEISAEYNLRKDERDVLYSALEEYGDTELVFKTFEFLKMTPYAPEAINDLYNLVEEKNISIEEAYAIYSGKESEELTEDDIAYYVSQGITTDDILAMYEVSLGCSEGLRTMLDRRVEGDSWCKITADVYGLDEQFASLEYDPRSILFGVVTARKLNIPFTEISALSDGDNIVAEEFTDKLIEQKLTAIEYSEKPNSFYGLESLDDTEIREPLFIDGEENTEAAAYLEEDLYESEITELPADEVEADVISE